MLRKAMEFLKRRGGRIPAVPAAAPWDVAENGLPFWPNHAD